MNEQLDNQPAIQPQPEQQSTTPSQNIITPEPEKKKSNKWIIVALSLTTLLFLGIAGVLACKNYQYKQRDKTPATAVARTKTAEVRPTKTDIVPTQTPTPSNFPNSWIIKTNSICHVSIPLPPKESPYYFPNGSITPSNNSELEDIGGFWQYFEESNYESELFSENMHVSFQNPNAMGSGYVPAMIQVICAPNNNSYTTQTLLDKYETFFQDGTYEGITLIKKGVQKMWGEDVAVISVEGGMSSTDEEYLLATPETIFRIRKIVMSATPIVKETVEILFSNLQFSVK